MPPSSNTESISGLTFMSECEGNITFRNNDGEIVEVDYDTDAKCSEDLSCNWNGSLELSDDDCGSDDDDCESDDDDKTWTMIWRFKEYRNGGEMNITFVSSHNDIVIFNWHNFHNGYYSHEITVNGKTYLT